MLGESLCVRTLARILIAAEWVVWRNGEWIVLRRDRQVVVALRLLDSRVLSTFSTVYAQPLVFSCIIENCRSWRSRSRKKFIARSASTARSARASVSLVLSCQLGFALPPCPLHSFRPSCHCWWGWGGKLNDGCTSREPRGFRVEGELRRGESADGPSANDCRGLDAQGLGWGWQCCPLLAVGQCCGN
jgi:hypothetical protein